MVEDAEVDPHCDKPEVAKRSDESVHRSWQQDNLLGRTDDYSDMAVSGALAEGLERVNESLGTTQETMMGHVKIMTAKINTEVQVVWFGLWCLGWLQNLDKA